MSDRPSISLRAEAHWRLSEAAAARGVSMSSIVEAALADLPAVEGEPREVVAVSRKRRDGQPGADVRQTGAWTISGGRLTPRGREIVAAFRAGATPTEVCGTFGCSRHTARRLSGIAMSETVAAAARAASVTDAEHERAKTARFVDVKRIAAVRR